MVLHKATAEIRRPFTNELIKIPARTKGGVALPAMEFSKRYYNAEIDGEPCMLRVRDNITVPVDLVKGALVSIEFATCEIEGDVSQIYVTSITCNAGKKAA